MCRVGQVKSGGVLKFQRPDLLALGVGGLPKVVFVLHFEPEARSFLAEGFAEFDGKFGGDAGTAVDHPRELDARDTEVRGKLCNRHWDSVETILDNSAGVRWVVHLHFGSP